jgi:hypothetical protein
MINEYPNSNLSTLPRLDTIINNPMPSPGRVEYDPADWWAAVPPECWPTCAHGHDWRRSPVQMGGSWMTVACCQKCQQREYTPNADPTSAGTAGYRGRQ